MDIANARDKAAYILELLIKHQPNLIDHGNTGTSGSAGKNAAEFSANFIEVFAKYLTDRK